MKNKLPIKVTLAIVENQSNTDKMQQLADELTNIINELPVMDKPLSNNNKSNNDKDKSRNIQ